MFKLCFLLLLVLQGLHRCVPEDTGQEDLPGHLQPLGAHMPPEQVRRLSHLPSPREFQEKFVTPQTPVIFEGAMRNSPVWRNWQNDGYFREHFGDEEVGIEQGKKENRSDPRYTLTVNEYLDRYKDEDIYLVDTLKPGMYQEWLVPRPLMCGGFRDNFIETYMWFSSGGTKSVLHTDSYENLHCLVSGRKEFVLIEPHYSAVIGPEHARKGYYDIDVERVDMKLYPELSKIPWYQAIVNEGDCLYLPYQWLHNVNSFGRNMGVNIWWIPFEFDDEDCPPAETQLPEYFPLADVQLTPEVVIIEALRQGARADRSVHVSELHAMMEEASEAVTYIELHHLEKMFDLLEPGCKGVITDYRSISKPQIKLAYEYMQTLEAEMFPGGDQQEGEYVYEFHNPLEDAPQDEFGGREMDYDGDYDHTTEGGGDYDIEDHHLRDEL